MYYGMIKKSDVADGPGVRVSLFVSGCRHHCEGCFNAETWDFKYGDVYTAEVEDEILRAMEPSYISGFTFLGGEPMEPENRPFVFSLAKKLREKYPEKTIWLYSGYLFDTEMLEWAKTDEIVKNLLPLIDVIVDGEFHIREKNLGLKFRGSENQRLIDVQRSLAEGKTILCDENNLR
ncbi:MAG: anaerobic ribonucleoside-triphosphate reductase activating protein [Lachnospiraceae bacterium]|nr:anaerobic ribonucleoside-triphosphate reductase activating protein [Lachnospiraceae bacterium]